MGRLTRMFIPRPARVVKRAVTHPVSTAVRAATPRPVRKVQRAAWKAANPLNAAQNAAWNAVTPKPKTAAEETPQAEPDGPAYRPLQPPSRLAPRTPWMDTSARVEASRALAACPARLELLDLLDRPSFLVFTQVDSMSAMVMVDGDGKRLEVIRLDRCDGHGPQDWIRVSWHHKILLGKGYYRRGELDQALALVNVGSLVEVITHPTAGRSPASPATPADHPGRQ